MAHSSKRVTKCPEPFDPSDVPHIKSVKRAHSHSAAHALFKQLEDATHQAVTQLEETERSILVLETSYLDPAKGGYGNALVGYAAKNNARQVSITDYRFSQSSTSGVLLLNNSFQGTQSAKPS